MYFIHNEEPTKLVKDSLTTIDMTKSVVQSCAKLSWYPQNPKVFDYIIIAHIQLVLVLEICILLEKDKLQHPETQLCVMLFKSTIIIGNHQSKKKITRLIW